MSEEELDVAEMLKYLSESSEGMGRIKEESEEGQLEPRWEIEIGWDSVTTFGDKISKERRREEMPFSKMLHGEILDDDEMQPEILSFGDVNCSDWSTP